MKRSTIYTMKNILIIAILFCAPASYAQTIKLDAFKNIPTEIDGCMGAYTYSTTPIANDRYIFVTDLQELGIIKINGKYIRLKKVSHMAITSVSSKDTYTGSGYTVVLLIKGSKRTGDELSENVGTLDISKGADKITIKVHGESGC
jgi:hypothetical protein